MLRAGRRLVAKKKQKSEGEAKPVLQLKVAGPGIRKGRVPVPELVRICQEAQNAINIQEECTLELIGIHGNSPTTLDFDLRKPQLALDFSEEFGEKAIREIIAGL